MTQSPSTARRLPVPRGLGSGRQPADQLLSQGSELDDGPPVMGGFDEVEGAVPQGEASDGAAQDEAHGVEQIGRSLLAKADCRLQDECRVSSRRHTIEATW